MSPSREDHALKTVTPAKLYSGADKLMHNLIGCYHRRQSRQDRWRTEAQSIHHQSLALAHHSDDSLRKKLSDLRQHFRRQGKVSENGLADAFALIAEASARTLGMRPFEVQILGALIIYHGGLAEMATGEGKSLTATLPAIIAGWGGRPCHILTTNDYLAARDAEQMQPLFTYCRVSSGWVGSEMQADQRRANYARDIVYTTSKELLADFLRDRLVLGDCHRADRLRLRRKIKPEKDAGKGLVMRGIDTAIVDEADSIFIDEAVTPLIISRPQRNESLVSANKTATEIVGHLLAGEDYTVDRTYREVTLTKTGKSKIRNLCRDLAPIWHSDGRREELIQTALMAREFYHRGKQYVIAEDKVVIVDEFTGRLMPERRWRQGLHQMIEAREKLPISDPNETLARLSFQRFFRFFRKLGGMTGTARESTSELWHVYGLPAFTVPTNRPCIREKHSTRLCPTQANKWQAICDEIKDCRDTGQPVLIGTRNVASSQQMASLLDSEGVVYQLLNAINHRQEAEIIATAGQRGKVTIATNMAGRGADIKLGKGVAELGGLHVIITEPHESARIDRQLSGRSARQGEPGSWRLYCSPEDEILQRYAPGLITRNLPWEGSASKPDTSRIAEKVIFMAQRMAQVKAFNLRKNVMQKDDWLTDALSFARTDLEGGS